MRKRLVDCLFAAGRGDGKKTALLQRGRSKLFSRGLYESRRRQGNYGEVSTVVNRRLHPLLEMGRPSKVVGEMAIFRQFDLD